VITGDTFESVSRKKYGTGNEAGLIASANPGTDGPLVSGTSIVIPALQNEPEKIRQAAPSNNEDEVAILIEGSRFRFWDSVRVTRSIDTMDTVEFGAPFDSNAPGFRESFRPFTFKNMSITIGGQPLFTGTMVAVNPLIETSRKVLTVSGYSLPGVLNDCTPPASAFPLEFDDLGLREIASALVAPFGLSVEFKVDQGAVFERVAIQPGQRILAFLTGLAKQRNLIISSSPRGKLLFLRSTDTGQPVANLEQGVAPVLSVSPFFSPQEYYSSITGLDPVIAGLAGSQFTVKNPRLLGVVRPLTFNAPDTLDSDVKEAVNAKAGRMFANMVSYSIQVATWRDPSGDLWAPDTIINLTAPDAMVYNKYKFTVRSVEFNRDSRKQTATLNLVIPGAFSGLIPESLPWDE